MAYSIYACMHMRVVTCVVVTYEHLHVTCDPNHAYVWCGHVIWFVCHVICVLYR